MKHNDTVYNRRGVKARYISNSPEGHIVAPEVSYCDEAGDDHYEDGEVQLWSECFLSAPKEVLEAEVAKLSNQLAGIRDEINLARSENRGLEEEIKSRKDRIRVHKGLERLDKFLSSGFSHYVTLDYSGIGILSKEDTKNDDYPKSFKLLSLFGRSNGDIEWKLNDYYDGSGGWRQVWPATSIEEAKEIAQRLHDEKWEAWRKEEKKHSGIAYFAKTAKALGFTVPEDVSLFITKNLLEEKERNVAAATKSLNEAKAALEQAIASSP